jgi:hypothetical protein
LLRRRLGRDGCDDFFSWCFLLVCSFYTSRSAVLD